MIDLLMLLASPLQPPIAFCSSSLGLMTALVLILVVFSAMRASEIMVMEGGDLCRNFDFDKIECFAPTITNDGVGNISVAGGDHIRQSNMKNGQANWGLIGRAPTLKEINSSRRDVMNFYQQPQPHGYQHSSQYEHGICRVLYWGTCISAC